MPDLNPAAVRQHAEVIAQAAAAVLMQYFTTEFQQITKSSSVDIVTEADRAAEILIVDRLQTLFPDHHIVGEEGGGSGAPADQAPFHWYVDPLDGTTNFANGIPAFCVSLAMTTPDLVPLVGVVYQPVTGELFSAAAGYGATLNDQPIHVSHTDHLGDCVLASGFPYDKATDADNNLDRWGRFLVRTRGLRRFGSAALDCCYVAAGRFDGYWEGKVHPWDVLAGMVIVQEAGGRISDFDGAPVDLLGRRRVVVSNGYIHGQMLDVLAEG